MPGARSIRLCLSAADCARVPRRVSAAAHRQVGHLTAVTFISSQSPGGVLLYVVLAGSWLLGQAGCPAAGPEAASRARACAYTREAQRGARRAQRALSKAREAQRQAGPLGDHERDSRGAAAAAAAALAGHAVVAWSSPQATKGVPFGSFLIRPGVGPASGQVSYCPASAKMA